MSAQPDDTTCGPTCLKAVYDYYGDTISLTQIIDEVEGMESGGTLAVFLACHALRRGYLATIYTYNLHVFDPTWFSTGDTDLHQVLSEQLAAKDDARLRFAIPGYQKFLSLGGVIRFEDLTTKLIRRPLTRGVPILTGLSATYLYREAREFGPDGDEDPIRGTPAGHFVVLCGYDKTRREVLVADPLDPNPLSESHIYAESIERVIGAILLGIITYDANLLIIEPPKQPKRQ